ncbi:MAG: Stf0 family sulfotransferase [Pseudomonadota bacterium]
MAVFDRLLASIDVDQQKLADELAQFQEPSRQYLVYMTPRTGSSWLRDLLRSTDVLGWPEEWFSTMMLRDFAASLNANTLDAYASLNRSKGQSSNGVYGATITWWDLINLWPDVLENSKSNFFNHFPKELTSAFALFRKDIVAQAVSLYRVRKTRQFDVVNSTATEREAAEKAFFYNEVKIKECLDHIVSSERQMHQFFAEYAIRPTILVYEDFTATEETRIIDFFIKTLATNRSNSLEIVGQSVHEKIATSRNHRFAERFRFDYLNEIETLEAERESIFEAAHYFEDPPRPETTQATPQPVKLATAHKSEPDRVAVIVPVYDGLRSVRRCFESLLASECQTKHRIVAIFDAGPDDRIEAYLKSLADNGEIDYFENAENLGFVRTVNRGFDIAGDLDVIILNSDTQTPKGWIDRIVALAEADPSIGTITPVTSNGEICSFPNICENNSLPTGFSADVLDALFAAKADAPIIDMPTSVGFCTYISRAALNAVGPFNEDAFGRGYGEENDFSMRTAKAGFRNVQQNNLFVLHEGGVSFGSEKDERVAQAVEVVNRLHPGYDERIQKYIHEDRQKPFRFKMVIECLKTSTIPLILLISHGEGGGTQRYVNELRNYFKTSVNFLWIEPIRENWVRLIFPEWAHGFTLELDLRKHRDALIEILHVAGVDLIHLNHLRSIEEFAFDLIKELRIPYIVTLHDYFFLGESPTLTNSAGMFAPDDYLPPRATESPDADARLNRMGGLLAGAEKVIAPSTETAQIYKDVLPDLEVAVRPHLGAEIIGEYPSVTTAKARPKKRICVIGALSKEKGADLLEAVSALSRQTGGSLEFHLIGYAYRVLEGGVITHGAYSERELQEKIFNLDPNLIWFPCHWPETFSYTLDAALEAGRPILTSSIGAMVSRTANRPFTWRHAHDASAEDVLNTITTCLSALDSVVGAVKLWENQPRLERFYTAGAYAPQQRQARKIEALSLDEPALQILLTSRVPQDGSVRSHLLPILMRLRTNPLISRFWFRLLPENMRNMIRQLLVSR